MYARTTRVQAPPDRLDDLIQTFTQTAIPALRGIPGYAGSALAVDRSSGDGQAVTWWESAEALANSESTASGLRSDTVGAAGGKVVDVRRQEIALREMTAPPSTPTFIRVTRVHADPTKIDAMVQATRDRALPALRNLQGFRGISVSVDRTSSDAAVVTIWATAADREASDAKIDEVRRAVFEIGGAGSPDVSRYEVVSVEFVGAGATA